VLPAGWAIARPYGAAVISMPPSGANPLFARIRDAARRIESIGAGNPRLEAEYLMAAALGVTRIRLWLIDRSPSAHELEVFEQLVARRLAHEPLQYVLGNVEFAGLDLVVGPGVLIPRSETEVLVERVESAFRVRHGDGLDAPMIVDVGTGSGAILLALLLRFPRATGIGIDIRPEALAWARRNAERLAEGESARMPGLAGRVEFLLGDLLEPLAPERVIDAVVSNPPYVRLDERDALAPEIRDHEPPEALFAGADGLDLIRRLIPQASARLRSGGLLAIEIGITQADALRDLLSGEEWVAVEICPDLTGRPRVARATRS
jgi:release factor glutamine methyltransferase